MNSIQTGDIAIALGIICGFMMLIFAVNIIVEAVIWAKEKAARIGRRLSGMLCRNSCKGHVVIVPHISQNCKENIKYTVKIIWEDR